MFAVDEPGSYLYTVEAWTNPLLGWWLGIEQRAKAGLPLMNEVADGIVLLEQGITHSSAEDAAQLNECARRCLSETSLATLLDDKASLSDIKNAMSRYRDPSRVRTHEVELSVTVDPFVARFSAWYQVFPRSCSMRPDRHGTLLDLAERLPRMAKLGFDVIYIPPIHPIGVTARKGRNNSLAATDGDPGSPWAIGSGLGGHKEIHPQLGTIDDFKFLIARARKLGIEIALDMALQCSPDHPYVHEHPEWFRRRADGSIGCAEDPPNTYEDIYPFDFECEERTALWHELRDIFTFWMSLGVKVFRVDNPHTKPFDFWEWLIRDLKGKEPNLVFLAEGLTRPSGMIHLGRIGFTQSYDYFPWRNTKAEIVDYYRSLNEGEVQEFFRPNLWPNTPQFLSRVLQEGGLAALMSRVILAATLSGNYGIYGPVYELGETRATASESTEYFDSEQYEIRLWDWERQTELTDLLSKLNQIRRSNAALQSNNRLHFHKIENEQLIAYSKTTKDLGNRILTVINLTPRSGQSGWLDLSVEQLGLRLDSHYIACDLLTGARYGWYGNRNYVALGESGIPAHILKLE